MIGKSISHYKIIENLGSGGMGVVYKAEDTKLKRTVALKFLPPEWTHDENAKARFMHEAQSASALDHNNICTIYEVDETENGQLFIAMTLYEGETLKNKIDQGLLKLEEAIELSIQIAQGLAKAHEKKIIHRDIKPANVFITDDGVSKILDFGLAKLAGRSMLTKEGTILGTVAYMSPDQMQGTDVDHRTDIWALGVILYEILVGIQPFKGDYEQEVMYSILHEEPEQITSLRNGIPVELELIVNKCMQKEPAARYQRVDELLVDLRQVQSASFGEKSVVSDFNSATTEIMLTRNKWKILFLGIALLVLLTVAGYLFFGGETKSREPKPIAVVGFENMTGDTTYNYLQKAIPNLLITSLEQSPHLQVATWERLYDLLKQTGREYTEIIDKNLGYELCRMEDINIIVVGSFSKAGNAFMTEVKILDVSSKRLLKGVTANGRGEESILLNQVDELSQEISKGVGILETSIKITHRPIAEVTTTSIEAYNYFIRGREYYEKNYEADAMRLLERAVELDSTFATAHLYLGRIYWNRGLGQKGAFDKAMAYSKAASEKERLFIETHYARTIERNPQKADSILQQIVQKYPKEKRMRHVLAKRYSVSKQYEKAIDEFNKVLDLDPNYTDVYNQLGYTFASMGDFDKAIESMKRYAALSPGDANPLDSIAEVYFAMGDVDAAISKFEEVQAIKPEFQAVDWRLGYAYALAENYSEAIRVLDKHLAMYPHSLTWYYWMRGLYRYFQGQVRQAWQDLQRSYEVADSIGNRRDKQNVERFRGWIYYELGKFESGRIAMQTFVKGRLEVNPVGKSYYKLNLNSYLGLVKVKLGEIDSAKYYLKSMEAGLPVEDSYLNEKFNSLYELLHAEILLAEGSAEKALTVVQKTSVEYDIRMNTNLTGLYNLPFKEDISARAYQKLGDFDGAIAEYKRLTTIDQSDSDRRLIPARFHYCLAKLYEKKGFTTKAIARYEHFLKVWKDADIDLPDLIDAKARIAKLKEEAL